MRTKDLLRRLRLATAPLRCWLLGHQPMFFVDPTPHALTHLRGYACWRCGREMG